MNNQTVREIRSEEVLEELDQALNELWDAYQDEAFEEEDELPLKLITEIENFIVSRAAMELESKTLDELQSFRSDPRKACPRLDEFIGKYLVATREEVDAYFTAQAASR